MHVHVITHMILAHNPLLPPFVFTNERAQILGNAYMYYINGCQIHFKHESTGVSSRSKWLTFQRAIREETFSYTTIFATRKTKKTAAKIHWRCWRKECRSPLQSNVFNEDEENRDNQIIQVFQQSFSKFVTYKVALPTSLCTCIPVAQE